MLGDLDRLRLRKALRELKIPLELCFHPTSPRGALSDEMEASALEIEKAGAGTIRLRQASAEESRMLPDRPALSLAYRGKCNIHYLAIPRGPQLLPFIETLLALPAGAAGHIQPWALGLAELRQEARLYVFMGMTCPHCPGAVRTACKLSLISHQVHSVIIDSQRYGRLVKRFGVRSVPTTVLDEGWSAVGVLPETELLQAILARGTPEFRFRLFESLLDSGRIEEAADNLAEGEPSIFAASWKRSTFSRRMSLMLVAEKLLQKNPRQLDPLVEELAAVLGSADAALRGDTADLLGRIGHADALAALGMLLEDPHPEVAEVAKQAVEEIRSRSATRP